MTKEIAKESNKAGYTASDAFALVPTQLIVVLVKNGTFAWFQHKYKPIDGQTDERTDILL